MTKPGAAWLSRIRSVLRRELHHIRHGNLDLNPADLTRFTFPLLLRLVGVVVFGAVPLIVVRSGVNADDVLIALLGSVALVAVCTAVVAWIIATAVSGLVLVVCYRTPPAGASQLVTRTVIDSFGRVSDTTARLATLALLAGLLALAVGLPTRRDDDAAHSVLDDLLAAQLGMLLAALGFAYLAETVRCSAELVDKKALLLAWPWALWISCTAWILATNVGPVETTRLLTILLNEWLPSTVDGTARAEVLADLVPASANWWAALAPLPVIAAVWALERQRHGGRRSRGPRDAR